MSELVPDTYSGPYGTFQARDPVMDAQMIAERLTPPLRSYEQFRASETPSIQIVIDENDRLRRRLERAVAETVRVRELNELLRRERVDVEVALGRSIHEGQLGPAVRMALYRETGR
jgi:hypothetical protein